MAKKHCKGKFSIQVFLVFVILLIGSSAVGAGELYPPSQCEDRLAPPLVLLGCERDFNVYNYFYNYAYNAKTVKYEGSIVKFTLVKMAQMGGGLWHMEVNCSKRTVRENRILPSESGDRERDNIPPSEGGGRERGWSNWQSLRSDGLADRAARKLCR
jgi:hypothetical protein